MRTSVCRKNRRRSIETLEGRILFAAFTWDGGGGDANWQTAENWVGDAAPPGSDPTDQLIFPASAAQKSNNNDFTAGTTFDAITIQDGGYTLAGNAITLGSIGISDTSLSGANAISFDIALSGPATIIDDDGGSTAALTLSGVISGSGSLTKDGDGSVIFTGANTYTGGTALASGNTFANNSTGSAFGNNTVTNTAGTLRGNGSFTGFLIHNSGLAPGATNPGGGSAGMLAVGGVTFGASASFGVNVFGATPGSGHNQLIVNGTVDLDSGHALNASGMFTPSGGEKLFIIVNDGSDAITGTFAGLSDPENDTVTIDGVEYHISYEGDSGTNATSGGNDVVLYLDALNVAPVITVPGGQTTNEDTGKVFSAENSNAISIADADAGSANIEVMLSVNNSAIITLPSASLVTAGANNSANVTLTGSQSAINSALTNMSVTPALNSSSTVTLAVAADDLGNTGSGGNETDSDTVAITVTAVNDAPVNTVPGTQSIAQNSSRVFSSANSNAITVAEVNAASSNIQVALMATDGTVALGTTSGISITGGANGTATVTFTGTVAQVNTAMSGLTFTPTGGFSGTATLQVATSDLGNTGTGGAQTDSDTININVAPAGSLALSAATYTIAENAGAGFQTITVNRTGGSAGQATIDYATSNGTATAGSDYTAVSGTLTFADGETSKTFNIPISDDVLDEADETVTITLSNVTNASAGAQSSATLTITDNDATPSLSIGDASSAEGNSGMAGIDFTVTLSAASGRQVTVDYATSDGTATTADSDYAAATGTLTFAAGETTKTITVNATGDATAEASETFTVTLSNPTNATVADATATGTITDDDSGPPSLSFAQDISVDEGNTGTSNATFTVELSAASESDVMVSYATQPGSAAASDDFTTTSGILTFEAGQMSKTINVPVVGDTLDEDNETFSLVLSSPSGASIGDGTAVGTIVDNDAPPSVSIADASGTEGTGTAGTVVFDVTLSTVSGRTVTVGLATDDGTAISDTDFNDLASDFVVTFAPGETTKTVTINTVGDTTDEVDETFPITTAALTNAVVGDGEATGTIVDDDAAPTLSIADATVAEPAASGSTNTATFTVTLSAASGKQVTVDFATSSGTASEGTDYTAATGTLAFAPGETSKTFSVAALFDGVEEPAETLTVTLSNAVNATIDDAAATGTLTNTAPNAAPVATDDAVTLGAGQPSVMIHVLGNDTDAEGDALTVAITAAPTNGTALVNSDGTITYTPTNANTAGSDTLSYSISDGIGGSDTGSVSITITGNGTAPNPVNPAKQDVFVAATTGSDQIQVVRVGRNVQILINGQDQGSYASRTTGNIVISGGAGDDTLVLGKVKVPVLFNGGEGDDELGGGAKGDILIGGPGADTLNGGAGRDIIIGGDGVDVLTGLGGNDILIAGATVYDADTLANRAALNDLLTELAARGRYATKLANLTSSTGVGASGAKLVAEVTVFDDDVADQIIGGGGQDLFVASPVLGDFDLITKKARNESVIEL